jgi:hypothetical protein
LSIVATTRYRPGTLPALNFPDPSIVPPVADHRTAAETEDVRKTVAFDALKLLTPPGGTVAVLGSTLSCPRHHGRFHVQPERVAAGDSLLLAN